MKTVVIGNPVLGQPQPGQYIMTIESYEGDMHSPNTLVSTYSNERRMILDYMMLDTFKNYKGKINNMCDVMYLLIRTWPVEFVCEWWNHGEPEDSEWFCETEEDLKASSDYISEFLSDKIGYGEYHVRWISKLQVEYVDENRIRRKVRFK